ncbi:hypothetical protein STEG23_017209, partial [Scotinomys teguina]
SKCGYIHSPIVTSAGHVPNSSLCEEEMTESKAILRIDVLIPMKSLEQDPRDSTNQQMFGNLRIMMVIVDFKLDDDSSTLEQCSIRHNRSLK